MHIVSYCLFVFCVLLYIFCLRLAFVLSPFCLRSACSVPASPLRVGPRVSRLHVEVLGNPLTSLYAVACEDVHRWTTAVPANLRRAVLLDHDIPLSLVVGLTELAHFAWVDWDYVTIQVPSSQYAVALFPSFTKSNLRLRTQALPGQVVSPRVTTLHIARTGVVSVCSVGCCVSRVRRC